MKSKQRLVIAVVVKDGLVLSTGTNEHLQPCKRQGYPTGVGYELCKYCQYTNHAEHNAVKGVDCQGATLYLLGHTYACEECKKMCEIKGIKEIIII